METVKRNLFGAVRFVLALAALILVRIPIIGAILGLLLFLVAALCPSDDDGVPADCEISPAD